MSDKAVSQHVLFLLKKMISKWKTDVNNNPKF